MRSFPSLYPEEAKVCAACGQSFARTDVHKNRHGEYICRACQAAGVKSTRIGRLRDRTKKTVFGFWLSLAIAAGLALLAWVLYAVFMHLSLVQFLPSPGN